jgi:hypothetical protein
LCIYGLIDFGACSPRSRKSTIFTITIFFLQKNDIFIFFFCRPLKSNYYCTNDIQTFCLQTFHFWKRHFRLDKSSVWQITLAFYDNLLAFPKVVCLFVFLSSIFPFWKRHFRFSRLFWHFMIIPKHLQKLSVSQSCCPFAFLCEYFWLV